VYTSTPAYLPDPLFDSPRVWFRDYLFLGAGTRILVLLPVSYGSTEVTG